MTSNIGQKPPLHRRFDEADSLRQIRDRYIGLKDSIANQVSLLQKNDEFLGICRHYYSLGYKDWHILAAVLNHMLNLEADRLKLGWSPGDMKRRQQVADDLHKIQFPSKMFTRQDMDRCLSLHAMTCLQRYGFEMRNNRVKTEVVERFLRERMMHFTLDIPHLPMFGEPQGSWPV
ncbi:hypothetical protein [Prosthecobacter sp.]|jgi:hypothetical protein|uniref:hypothetical protein n=1 Tax=Prosthecobacter sp. TaxID=1965333 RepID=UPI0037C52CA6